MQKKNYPSFGKIIGVIGLSALILSSHTPITAHAAEESMVAVPTQNETYKNVVVAQKAADIKEDGTHLVIVATKTAEAEPEWSIQKREADYQQRLATAEAIASEQEKVLEQQRIDAWNQAFPTTGNAFMDGIAKEAILIAREHNLYPSVLIAQAAHESSFGESGLGAAPYFNLFGIKGSYNGNFVTMRTREEYNGQSVYIDAAFRKYQSWSESMGDYADLLATNLYSGSWRSNAPTAEQAANALAGIYATDSAYAVSLNRVMSDYGLTRFDNIQEMDTTPIHVEPIVQERIIPDNIYVVKESDSLTSISIKTGIPILDIMQMNALEGPELFVNQELLIEKPVEEVAVEATDESETKIEAKDLIEVETAVERIDLKKAIKANESDVVSGIKTSMNTTPTTSGLQSANKTL